MRRFCLLLLYLITNEQRATRDYSGSDSRDNPRIAFVLSVVSICDIIVQVCFCTFCVFGQQAKHKGHSDCNYCVECVGEEDGASEVVCVMYVVCKVCVCESRRTEDDVWDLGVHMVCKCPCEWYSGMM